MSLYLRARDLLVIGLSVTLIYTPSTWGEQSPSVLSKISAVKSVGKTIVVTATFRLEFKEKQGVFKMKGLNGELLDAAPPMRPTGRYQLTFNHDKKQVVLESSHSPRFATRRAPPEPNRGVRFGLHPC